MHMDEEWLGRMLNVLVTGDRYVAGHFSSKVFVEEI